MDFSIGDLAVKCHLPKVAEYIIDNKIWINTSSIRMEEKYFREYIKLFEDDINPEYFIKASTVYGIEKCVMVINSFEDTLLFNLSIKEIIVLGEVMDKYGIVDLDDDGGGITIPNTNSISNSISNNIVDHHIDDVILFAESELNHNNKDIHNNDNNVNIKNNTIDIKETPYNNTRNHIDDVKNIDNINNNVDNVENVDHNKFVDSVKNDKSNDKSKKKKPIKEERRTYSITKIKVKNIDDDEIIADSLSSHSSTSSIKSVNSVNSVNSVKSVDSVKSVNSVSTVYSDNTYNTQSSYSIYIPSTISSPMSSFIKSVSSITTISSTDNVYSEEYEETFVRTKIIGEQDENLIDFNIDMSPFIKNNKKKNNKRTKKISPQASPTNKKVGVKKEIKQRISSILLQYDKDINVEEFDDIVKEVIKEIKLNS